MSDTPLAVCPKCGAAVRRLIGRGSGIIFKGSGFYATDYRSQNYKKRQKEEENTNKQPAKPCTKANSSKECTSCQTSRDNNKSR